MRKILVYLMTLFLAVNASCQKDEGKKTIQTLRLNFQEGDVPSLHPYYLQAMTRGHTVATALFEGLTRLNQEGNPELTGAEKVEISPCKTQYTFTLRPHNWSDGTPVTAYQYEKTWKEALHPKSNCPLAQLLYVVKNAQAVKKGEKISDEMGVKALDANTLFVELAFPAPYFMEALALPVFLPVQEVGREPIHFNGPFIVKQWKKENRLVLKANRHYWDRKNIHLDSIDIKMVADPSTALYLYEKGDIDWIGDPLCPLPNEAVIQLRKRDEHQQKEVIRPFYVYLNTESFPLNSPSLRQALSLAIDRSAIAEHILVGDLPLYTPLPRRLSLSSTFLQDHASLKAKHLFEQGLKELGLSRKTFPSITLSYSHQAQRKSLAEYLKQTWEKTFGIDICLNGYDWNTFYDRIQKGQFQIGGLYMNSFINDPIDLLERLKEISPMNFSQWTDLTYQKKLQKSNEANSWESRNQILKEAEEILLETIPLIPVVNQNYTFTHHPQLKGYVFDHSGGLDVSRAFFSD